IRDATVTGVQTCALPILNMVCYQALGNDVTIAAAAEAGQLELNVMMPVIAHNLLFTMQILTNASRVFAERGVEGIEADRAQCEKSEERRVGKQGRARDVR